ncbi:hypothetical protein TRVA0_001S02696 [Trichomonascus vanleenenianus]|uniref:Smu2p n=1 Tax=Trichomonascus vanleenenianus TaxID=2268995 RepID=UPI003ECB1CDE
MPRKRPRNPLKRKQVEFDAAPDKLINPRKKQGKHIVPKDAFVEEEGGNTPKEFLHLMNKLNKKTTNETKKNDKDKERGRKPTKKTTTQNSETNLKIQPGERMSDFVRRVDQALPLIKARSGSPSRLEKRKIKQRRKAERQAMERKRALGITSEDEEEEQEAKKKAKRDPSPDMWAHLETKPRPKFNEVADRPPDLRANTKKLINVPKTAGSLAKRELLADERQKIIDGYRKLMEEKRGKGDV